MSSSANKYDTIDKMIFEENLRIKAIDFHTDLDLILFILNSGKVIRRSITGFPSLMKGTNAQLIKYELISNGVGVHWPLLDEDLSLKGILSDEIKKTYLTQDVKVA